MNKPFMAILIGVEILLAWLLLSITPVRAHHAPSGWQYPDECCSSHQDCQMIHVQNIQVEASGYRIVLKPGEHRHIPQGGSHFFPYGDARIRQSGDTDYHVCVSAAVVGQIGETAHSWYCLYIPPGLV